MKMKMIRQTYIQPCTELIFVEPMDVIAGSPPEIERRGYALDNKEADDEKIIDIWQQEDDDFLDID